MAYVHDWTWRPGWRSGSMERMAELVIRWLLLAVAVWVAAKIVPGIHLLGWKSTLLVALVLGILNLYLRPLLVALSLPITLITLGIFLIVINAGLLYLTSKLVGSVWVMEHVARINFHVDDFWAAVLGAIVISVVSFVVGMLVNPRNVARNLTG